MLAGCSGTDKKQPTTADIKLGDLAPVNPVGPVRPTQTVAFEFYSLELPEKNVSKLSDIWPILYTKPVQLTEPGAFSANSFRLVFGELQMWQKTATLLESAGAVLAGRARLLLDYGQTDHYIITKINEKTDVSYLTRDMAIESLAAQPGRLVLRVWVSPVAGTRGVCDFHAMPELIPAKSRNPTEKSTKTEDVAFESLGFTVEMSPGDFFLLGPENHPGNENSLGSLFFTTAKNRKIRVYVVFCSEITD
jgi:hypothetical protein